jgi:hypothetical protein
MLIRSATMKSMRKILLAAAAIGLAGSLSDGFGAQSAVPESFYSRVADHKSPIWISADLARAQDNQIDWKLFSPDERASLRNKLATQKRVKAEERIKSLSSFQSLGREPVQDDNCITYESAFHHLGEELEGPGLGGLLRSARGVYSATIADMSQGFFLGSPATVLKLEISEAWKTESGLAPKELFGVYPFARFAIGEGVFCSGVPGKLLQPKIGQRVIVFFTSKPVDRQQALFWVEPDFLITERSDGGVSLPPALKNDPELFPVQSLDEAEELLRRALRLPGRENGQ